MGKINPATEKKEQSRPRPIQTRAPSGAKLILQPDSDCVLQFLTIRDISDYCGKKEGDALLLTAHDGKQVVAMPIGFAVRSVLDLMEPGAYYYFHNQSEIEMPGKNPMKDIEIWRLGNENESVDADFLPHPDRIAGDAKTFTLTHESIAEANYTRLNYPLRPPL